MTTLVDAAGEAEAQRYVNNIKERLPPRAAARCRSTS